jgi:ABC-type lipoprotein export system ATPase subunit/uncharacterized coiled-coil protein SlyX
MSNTQSKKGSSWLIWDLHVHTPESDGYSGNWDEFETQIKNSKADVIGINDYCTVAGYKKIKKRIQEGNLIIDNKVLLPVVELRMTESVQNKDTKTNGVTHFNFHVIFNPKVQTEDIETFIKSLKSNQTIIGEDYNDKTKLKQKKVSFWKLIEDLKTDEKFKDNFLIWLPYDEYGGIDPIDPQSDGWIKENFIKTADILGSGNQKQIDFFLWRSPKNKDGTLKFPQDDFKNWFEYKKPCLKGSDSHNKDYPVGQLRDANSKPTERYCWIKAEPTFEGLKQIKFEPDTRIHIGSEKPKIPVNKIDSITLDIKDNAKLGDDVFCFSGNNASYELSPYFNCIIGGRGSGKSTILNFLGQYSSNPETPDEFWTKVKPNFDPKDSSIFRFDGTEKFEYLAQSEIESFAKNEKQFTEAIYRRANRRSGDNLHAYEMKIEGLKNTFSDIVQAIIQKEELENQKSQKLKEKRTLESSLKVLESEEYSKLLGEVTEKSVTLQSILDSKGKVDELKISINEILPEYTEDEVAEQSEEEDSFSKAYSEAVTKLREGLEILSQKNFVEANKDIESLQESIQMKEAEIKELLKKSNLSEENIEQIKSAPQAITTINSEIKNLESKVTEQRNIINQYSDTLSDIKKAREQYETELDKALKPLLDLLSKQADRNEGKDIKEISLTYKFNSKEAWEQLTNDFYNIFESDRNERASDVCGFIIKHKDIFETDNLTKIQELIEEVNKKDGKLYISFLNDIFQREDNFLLFKTIRDKHLYDVTEYKIINVKYGGTAIESASFGQKCTAVVVILLLFSNYPLIIDEPEAHLDSSLIANYLVPLIKEKKVDRQIIFATHNANFVINGDAEKIFILNNEDGTTSITETTIENLDHRAELMKLEGGKEAFEKRGDKLGMKSKLV